MDITVAMTAFELKWFRCTKGHVWNSTGSDSVRILVGNSHSESFCVRCLIEMLHERCGTVTETPPDKKE